MAEQDLPTTQPSSTNKGGRPTKLNKKLVDLAETYIEYAKDEKELPTIEGLAIFLGVNRSTLYEWRKIDVSTNKVAARFSDILNDVDTHQAYHLINGSVKGLFNASISKMMLSKHGYVEKSEVDSNLTGEVQFVNDVPRPKRGA